MLHLKDVRIAGKLALLIGTAALALIVFGAVGNSMLDTVKVGGPIYNGIVETMVLDSDLMPPDLYLTEADGTLKNLLREKDPAAMQKYAAALKDKESSFEQKHEKYERSVPTGKIKDLLEGSLYTEGKAWIGIVDSVVVPAKLRNDEKTMNDGLNQAAARFEAHKKAVYDLDKMLGEMRAQQENEAQAIIRSRLTVLVGIGLAALVVIVLFGLFTTRLITSSLGKTVSVLEVAAVGDLRPRVSVDSKDEAGVMGQALNNTLDRIAEAIRSINESALMLASASEEFSSTSQQITANSEETSTQANVVSAATEEINRNLQTVASSTQEMTSTIGEISKHAGEAARVASEALQSAVETNATVAKLGESSSEIGQVIKVIRSIAQQTNLLALNATIEAARAGEAGKGFAVVANEVKELAKQTAKATEDISQRIAAIQGDTQAAVSAISKISGIIGRVNDISTIIASAVEEQSATTTEMSRNVAEAAKGSGEVAKNIGGVAQAAQSTSAGAGDSQRAAQRLAGTATQLQELVGKFKFEGSAIGPVN